MKKAELLVLYFLLILTSKSLGQFLFGFDQFNNFISDTDSMYFPDQKQNKEENHVNHDFILSLQVDNDMTFFTDQYYSSGVYFQIFASFMDHSPVNSLMLPGGADAESYYALTFTHRMYTPIYIDTLSNRTIDHPFAAYMLLGNRKETFYPAKHKKLISEFKIGVIGPIAGGQVIQNTLHDHISIAGPVKGWEYQIDNDLCLQYNVVYEKGLIHGKWFDLDAYTGGKLGIPHTEAKIGTGFRVGRMEDYFRHIGIGKHEPLQIWLFCNGDVNVVAYNAVLQGGLFHREAGKRVNRIEPFIWHTSFGGVLVYKNIYFELAQEVISPSFPTALWHRWAYARLMIGF